MADINNNQEDLSGYKPYVSIDQHRAQYTTYYANRLVELGIVTPEVGQRIRDKPDNFSGKPDPNDVRLTPTQLAQASFAIATGQIRSPNYGEGALTGSNADRTHPVHSLAAALNKLQEAGAPITDLVPGGKATVAQVGKLTSDALHTYYANDAKDKFKEINSNPNLTPQQRSELTRDLLAEMQFKGLSYSDLGDPEAVKQKLKQELANHPSSRDPSVAAYHQNLLSGIDDRPPPGTKWKKEQECIQAFVNGRPGSFIRDHASGNMFDGRVVKQAADVEVPQQAAVTKSAQVFDLGAIAAMMPASTPVAAPTVEKEVAATTKAYTVASAPKAPAPM